MGDRVAVVGDREDSVDVQHTSDMRPESETGEPISKASLGTMDLTVLVAVGVVSSLKTDDLVGVCSNSDSLRYDSDGVLGGVTYSYSLSEMTLSETTLSDKKLSVMMLSVAGRLRNRIAGARRRTEEAEADVALHSLLVPVPVSSVPD